MYTDLDESISWDVYAFEANPEFNKILTNVKANVSKRNHTVKMYQETAAWTYDGTIDFYLDTVNKANNFWGSSIDENHPDVILSGKQKVTVKCVDISRILKKYNQDDVVIVKIDIEGAEYDLLLDFIKKDVTKIIDYLAVEFHRQLHRYKEPEQVFLDIIKLSGTKYVEWS